MLVELRLLKRQDLVNIGRNDDETYVHGAYVLDVHDTCSNVCVITMMMMILIMMI